jgi:hypothetical protein
LRADLHLSVIFSENRKPLFGIMLFAFEHDLFRKPETTFRDHALEHLTVATAALDQPGGERAGYDRAAPDLQIFPSQKRALRANQAARA